MKIFLDPKKNLNLILKDKMNVNDFIIKNDNNFIIKYKNKIYGFNTKNINKNHRITII